MAGYDRIELACRRAGIELQTEAEAAKNPFVGKFPPLHCLFAEFKARWCGWGKCLHRERTGGKYYRWRCIPALCFVQWLAKEGIVEFKEESLADLGKYIKETLRGEK